MIMFVQDDPGRDTVVGHQVLLKLFIQKFNGYLFIADDIFADFGNAQTTLIIAPLLSVQFVDMCIDKHLLDTWFIRVFSFILFILIGKNLVAVDDKETDIPIHLWCGQSYPA